MERHNGVRDLTTWELTNALILCFVFHLGSYRDVDSTLGIPDSTLGGAIRNRNSGFFQKLCDLILLEIRAKTECRKIKKAITPGNRGDPPEGCRWNMMAGAGHKS